MSATSKRKIYVTNNYTVLGILPTILIVRARGARLCGAPTGRPRTPTAALPHWDGVSCSSHSQRSAAQGNGPRPGAGRASFIHTVEVALPVSHERGEVCKLTLGQPI